MRKVRLAFLAVALACACGCVATASRPSTVEEVLARWDADRHGDLKAIVVRRGGVVIAERYYNGDGPDTLHDIRSAGKSVTSLLLGIAIDRGSIASTADPVSRYLPEAAHGALSAVTVEDLLTMRSGLDAVDVDPASPGNEDKLDAAADPVAFALAVPSREAPGTRYVYNSLTAYLAGLVIERAVGRPVDAFARDVLFSPLGITRWRWRRDAGDHTTGEGNLSITARDFAAIGQLVLDRGVSSGRRIVSERWLDASLAPRVPIGAVDPYADAYGYLWYSRTHVIAGERVRVDFASGNGGNKIYLVPSRSMVVAITSSAYGQGYGQRRSQQILLDVLAAR